MAAIELFLRSLGAFSLLPLGIGNRSIARKIGVSALITILLIGEPANLSLKVSVTGAALNFILGLMLILPLALTARVGAMVGELFDLGRGQSIGQIYDPLSSIQSGLSGVLLSNWIWLCILGLGGLEQLIIVLAESVENFPDVTLLLSESSGQHLVNLISQIVGGSLHVSGLCLSLFIVVEALAALLTKAVPQINSQVISFQIKSALALLTLLGLLQTEFPAAAIRSSIVRGTESTLQFLAGIGGRGQGI